MVRTRCFNPVKFNTRPISDSGSLVTNVAASFGVLNFQYSRTIQSRRTDFGEYVLKECCVNACLDRGIGITCMFLVPHNFALIHR